MALIVFAVVAYLIGSVPFAILSSRLFGLADPRTYGSGNPGATNVLRTGKKGAAAFTLIGDLGKGWVAVVLAQWLAPKYGLGSEAVAAVALAVFLGHLYPVFIGFKGGKGVATALGVLLALDPSLGLMALVTWLVMAFAFRYSSLAALTAAGLAPVYAGWLLGPGLVFGVVVLMSALLVWRHRANLRNLVDGRESRIGGSPGKRRRHKG